MKFSASPGIAGNGQSELVEVLAGLRDVEEGNVILDGVNITHSSSLRKMAIGDRVHPSDRIHVGSIADFSLVENTTMNYYFDDDYYRQGASGLRQDAHAD